VVKVPLSSLALGWQKIWRFGKEHKLTSHSFCMQSGWIYILTNKGMPGLVKIGMSQVDVDSRVKELSASTSAPFPFTVVQTYRTEAALSTEKRVHRLLDPFRVNREREFFQLTPHAACFLVERAITESSCCPGLESTAIKPSKYPHIGAVVRELRKRKGLTQAELVVLAGMSSTARLVQLEKGRNMEVSTLQKLLAALGMEMAFIATE